MFPHQQQMYFPTGFHYATFLNYLIKSQLTSQQNFQNLKHIAFHFNMKVQKALRYTHYAKNVRAKPILFHNFQALESISLFIHEFYLGTWDWKDGKLVLYPP